MRMKLLFLLYLMSGFSLTGCAVFYEKYNLSGINALSENETIRYEFAVNTRSSGFIKIVPISEIDSDRHFHLLEREKKILYKISDYRGEPVRGNIFGGKNPVGGFLLPGKYVLELSLDATTLRWMKKEKKRIIIELKKRTVDHSFLGIEEGINVFEKDINGVIIKGTLKTVIEGHNNENL